MLKIEHIKGRDLVEALNNAEDLIPDHYDEMYGCEFFYESQVIKDDMFILYFSIENGYYIKDNVIKIPRDFSTFNKRQHIGLEEPFDGGGMPSEIFELVKVFVEKFEANLLMKKLFQF